MRTKINQENYERNNALLTERTGINAGETTKRGEQPVEPEEKRVEEGDNEYDEKELVHDYEGWEFYKRKKIPHTMVRRYCQTLD